MTTYPLAPRDMGSGRPGVALAAGRSPELHSPLLAAAPSRRSPPRTVIRRRWPSMVTGFALVVAIVGGVSLLMPPRYESRASFLIEEPAAPTNTVAALSVLERIGQAGSVETEVALLRSHRVIEPVVDLLDLNVVARTRDGIVRPDSVLEHFTASADALPGTYALQGDASSGIRLTSESGTVLAGPAAPGTHMTVAGLNFVVPATSLRLPLTLEVTSIGRAVDRVRERLHVAAADRNAEVIVATCDGRTPGDAQRLCSEVSNSYFRLRATLQRAEATAAATFLLEQSVDVGKRLARAEDSLRTYARASQAIALDVQARDVAQRFSDVKAQREMLAAERTALTTLVSDIENGDGGAADYRRLASFPSFMKSQNTVIAQLVETLVQLENRRSELAMLRSESNPELAAVNQRLADVQRQLRSLASTYAQGLGAQITSLDQSLVRAGRDLDAIPAQEIQSARFRREIGLQEELYRFLQTRLHEAEVAKAVNLPSVRLVDDATLPDRLASPNIPLNLGLAGVLGLGFGLMLAVYREHSDTRIYEQQEVDQGLGVPVLGMVGQLHRHGPISAVPAPPTGMLRLLGETKLLREQELAWESFHALTTDLRSAGAGAEGGKIRSIAVTSSSGGEGKTFVSCNLALGWASYPARTLIIDADLRGGSVSRFFGLASRSPGLSDVLAGRADLEAAIRVVDSVPGVQLHVLPAGTYLGRAAELIDTAALDELLRKLEEQFDLVVVDTPPLNVLSDAASVASRVDAVLVVARGGTTERVALGLTLHRIARVGGHSLGVVLNGVTLPDYYVRYSKLEL